MDRAAAALALAPVHHRRVPGAVRAARPHHLHLLHRHRGQLPQRASQGRVRLPASLLPGHHPPRQDQDRQDDARHRVRVRALLESVLRAQPAAGVRRHPAHADQHRRGLLRAEPRPAQLRGQPAHLLSVLDAHLPHAQEGAALHVGAGAQGVARRGPGPQLRCDGDGHAPGHLAVPPRRPAPPPRHHTDSRAPRAQRRHLGRLVVLSLKLKPSIFILLFTANNRFRGICDFLFCFHNR
ncbi:hypothetical protein FOCC_FOCC013814 [Frankliniella occidentalis]|nr:hypothetical protein FOCC_FOCC013814 [Frankliniella occidentalis]